MKRRAGVKGVNQGDEEGDLPAGPTALARAGR